MPEIFINNAGLRCLQSAVRHGRGDGEEMIRLNVMALTSLSLPGAPHMKRRGRGRIMNVASTAAFQPCPYLGVYGATKSYVLSFTESTRRGAQGLGRHRHRLLSGPTRTQFGVTAGLSQESPLRSPLRRPERVAETGFKA